MIHITEKETNKKLKRKWRQLKKSTKREREKTSEY